MAVTQDVERVIRDEPARGLFRVRRTAYHDEGIHRQELATIFRTCWLYLGHESELAEPNSFLLRRVANRPILFLRDHADQFRAFLNICPHRGAEVCREPRGRAKAFQCMYHGWVFGTDGALRVLNGAESFAPDINADGSLNLPAVPRLESYRGFHFINFDAGAISLAAYLGNVREFIDVVVDQSFDGMRIVPGTHEYLINANWKLLAENSVDIYHGPSLHPTYIDYLRGTTGAISPLAGKGGVSIDLGGGHSAVEYEGPWGRPIAQWIPMWGEQAKVEIDATYQRLVDRHGEERAFRLAKKSRNILIFPNLVINDIGAITVRTFQPTAPGVMLAHSWALAPAEETEDFLARRLDNYTEFLGPAGFATPDDIEALESCQRGFVDVPEAQWTDLSKGAGSNQHDWEDEVQQRAFWRRWREVMANALVAA
jgi:p-cumate 2,3-dioxygenase alpha subunit